jgi:protoheme IX farnesyltransferase
MINPKTTCGAISIFLYTSVYTPLKTVTSLSVFVGAAFSILIVMWVGSATGDFGIEAGTFFLFSGNHIFWAIGWFLYEDYEEQVFMFPTEKDGTTGYFIYRLVIIASLIPLWVILVNYLYRLLLRRLFFYWVFGFFYAVKLYKLKCSNKNFDASKCFVYHFVTIRLYN